MCVGHTLGEEILFSTGAQVRRTESVVSQSSSCVMQINLKILQLMSIKRHIGAGGANMSQDYSLLSHILESHYKQKNKWRSDIGVFYDETLPTLRILKKGE